MKHFLPYLILFFASAAIAQNNLAICSSAATFAADSCEHVCLSCSLDGYVGSNALMTPSLNTIFPCGTLENDQWLAFTPRFNNVSLTVTPDSCTTGDGLELAIYADCQGTPIECKPGQIGGGPITINATLIANQPYYLLIDGFNGDVCTYTVQVNNSSTTTPNWGNLFLNGPQWVAAFDTAVYSVLQAPQALSYTWSAPLGATINGMPSPVTLPANTGYQVTVVMGAYSGLVQVTRTGICGGGPFSIKNVIVGLDFFNSCTPGEGPSADNCNDACTHCDLFPVTGSTQGFTPDGPDYQACGITQHNNQWYRFVAGAPMATFTASPSDCQNGDGIQMAIFTGCYEQPLPFGCMGGMAGGGDTPLTMTVELTVGQEYYLMIDGFIGDICAYTVTVMPPQAALAPPLGATPAIQGPTQVCPNGGFEYSLPTEVAGATTYAWTLPPGAWSADATQITDSPYWLGGRKITVYFGPSSGQVCVTPLNACNTGATQCMNVQVVPLPPVNTVHVYVCFEDAPYELPWGDYVTNVGTYTYQYTYYTVSGCDSVVNYKVTIFPPIFKNLAPKYLCPGQSITVCGNEFSDPGVYSEVCESWLGCDSINNFTIILLSPNADIIAPNTSIPCGQGTLCLNSAASPGIKVWRNQNNQIVGNGNTLCISQPGTYILTVTVTGGGVNCIDKDTIEITSTSGTPPVVSAVGGNLDCNVTCLTLMANTNVPATYLWTGPGFQSNVQNPVVCVAGNYTVSVTDAVTGCVATATALVTSDQTPLPAPNFSFSSLSCSNTFTEILTTFSENAGPLQYEWTGENGFQTNAQIPYITVPGAYQVTITRLDNGCFSAFTVQIPADFEQPSIEANNGSVGCFNPTTILTAVSNGLNASYSWTGPNNFAASVPSVQVSTPGVYTVLVTAANGCTNSINTIVTSDPSAPTVSVTGGQLNCIVQEIQLSALILPAGYSWTYQWSGPDGYSSNDANPVVTAPGTYMLTATEPNSGCQVQNSINISQDMTLPQVAITVIGVLDCAHPSILLDGATDVLGAEYSYAGPNGFSAFIEDPLINTSGQYTLTVTNPINQCSNSATITVLQDTLSPEALLGVDVLTCSNPVQTIETQIDPSFANLVFSWSGPGGFSSNLQNPQVTTPGTYGLIVLDSVTGCQEIAEITVVADQSIPSVSAEGGNLDCNHPIVYLDASTTTAGVSFVWQGPGGESVFMEDTQTSVPGTYTVMVTASNGCTNTAVVVVLEDVALPALTAAVFPDQDNQGLGSIDLNITGGTSPFTVWWWLQDTLVGNTEDLDSLYAGTYQAIVQGANGCADTLEVVLGNTIQVTQAEVNASDWRVFPNPANQWLNIQFLGDHAGDERISLIDVTGKKLLDGSYKNFTSTRVDIQDIPSGAYVLSIQNEAYCWSKVIVIE
jgi:hypothetical protein